MTSEYTPLERDLAHTPDIASRPDLALRLVELLLLLAPPVRIAS